MKGDPTYLVPNAGIDELINEITSEHDGEVRVLIFLGPFTESGLKVVVHEDGKPTGNILLAVFKQNYVAIFEEDLLNVKELIFVMDNSRIPASQFIETYLKDVVD